MNSFLRKFKPVFRNNRVSIVMILLMLTILILGVSRSGLFSRNVQAQTALKTSAEKPMFELGESTQKDKPFFELEALCIRQRQIHHTQYPNCGGLHRLAHCLPFLCTKSSTKRS